MTINQEKNEDIDREERESRPEGVPPEGSSPPVAASEGGGVPGEARAADDEDGEEGSPEKEEADLRGLFEAVIFLSAEPLPISFFVKQFGVDPTHTKIIIDSLVDEYEERDGGVRLMEISRGYQFVTNKRYAEQIRRVMGFDKRERLSRGMLETLSIVSYKQPISIAEIDELRGVSSRMMVANLMKKNLIRPVGRKELPGRPLAYGTTDEFLRYFGLNKISDLPRLSEIKELAFSSEE
jgi:segregation and condensation protein B